METGLEKMRNKIVNSDKWKQMDVKACDFGSTIDVWYNETIDVTCYMRYDVDMDQELYIVGIDFIDGKCE